MQKGLLQALLPIAAVLMVCTGFAAPPYNIVLIMVDDCSLGEFSSYGSTENLTPEIDTLGENGVRFRSAWCTPICNPTRTELMTGCYAFRTHRYHNSMTINTPLTNDGYILFSNWLRSYGYATMMAGKWQLPQRWDAYGFDEYCVWAYEDYIPADTPPEIIDHWEEKPGLPSRYWHPSIVTNGVYMDTIDTDYGPDIFADYAINFMARHKDQPFLVYYPMVLTHDQFYPTPDSIQPGEDPMVHDLKNFSPMVEYADKIVGQIIDALDTIMLADGVTPLRSNTIVMFCTDNGNGFGLEAKDSPSEGGCASPLVISCPGVIPTIGWSDELVDFTDFLPTLVDLAGQQLPTNYVHDGRSFAPYILGETNAVSREWMFSYLAHNRMLRDKRWLWEPPNKFYDTGGSRDGSGYVDVTDSTDPEVLEAKARFAQILKGLPAPRPDDPAYPVWHNYVRTLNTNLRLRYFLNTDPLTVTPPVNTNAVDTYFNTGPLTAAGAQTAGNPVIHFDGSAESKSADVTLTDFSSGVDFDGNPGIDALSGTFTVTAKGSNGTNNEINVNTDQNGIRPTVGFDEATITLSLSGWTLTAVNGAPPASGVSVTLDGFNGFTFGLNNFTSNTVVGVQSESGVVNYDNGANYADGTTGELFTFTSSATVVVGKGIGSTSVPGTLLNDIRIGGVNAGEGLSFQFTGRVSEILPIDYNTSNIRIDDWKNILIELPQIWDQSELLLEFTDSLTNSVPWVTVDRYTPAAEEVGQPFRFEQYQSLDSAFYRIRPNP